MEGKTIAIFLIAALIFGGVLVGPGSIPTSAYSGGQQTIVCTLKLSASGNYNDLVVSHYVSDFAVTGGGTSCHTQTLLDLIPASQFNLFPVSLTFSVVLTSQSDGINAWSIQHSGKNSDWWCSPDLSIQRRNQRRKFRTRHLHRYSELPCILRKWWRNDLHDNHQCLRSWVLKSTVKQDLKFGVLIFG